MFMRMIGMSVGAALFGAIVNFGVHRHVAGGDDAVNRLLDTTTRSGIDPDTLARLTDAVGIGAHQAFIAGVAIAALTLIATLALPARLSPIRPALAEARAG